MTATGRVPTVPALRRASDLLGKQVHNLVLEYDSGYAGMVEFRVQCEVLLDLDTADKVRSLIEQHSVTGLQDALELISPKVASGATKKFSETIRRGFQDNIDRLKNPAEERDREVGPGRSLG